MRVLTGGNAWVILRVVRGDEARGGARPGRRRAPRLLEDRVRGGGALGHAGGGGARAAVALSVTVEGTGARGARTPGASSRLRIQLSMGAPFAGEHLPKEASPRRDWAVPAAAQSSRRWRWSRTGWRRWPRSARASGCPIYATSNSRGVRPWDRGAFAWWWCRLGARVNDASMDGRESARRGGGRESEGEDKGTRHTLPELGDVGLVQGLGVDPLDGPLDAGGVDDDSLWENPRHGGRTGAEA